MNLNAFCVFLVSNVQSFSVLLFADEMALCEQSTASALTATLCGLDRIPPLVSGQRR